MKKLYLSLIAVFFMHALFAQNIDSLLKKYMAAKTVKTRLAYLNDIANSYMMDGNQDSLAKVYGNKMITIANQDNDKRLLTKAYLLNGKRWVAAVGVHETERLKLAFDFINKTIDLARQYNFPDIEADAYLQLSVYYRSARINDINKSLDYVTRAQGLLAANPNDSLSVIAYRTLGNIYLLKGDQINTFRSYINALNLADKIDNKLQLAECYRTMGRFYASLDDYDKAIDDNQRAYDLLDKNNLTKSTEQLVILQDIAAIYAVKKDYAQARKYYWRVYDLAKKQKMHQMMIDQNLFYIEATYLEEKNYKELIKYVNDPHLTEILKRYQQDYLLDFYKGQMYDMQNKRDSAMFYYKHVMEPAQRLAAPPTLIALYIGYGFALIKNGQTHDGLNWMEKAKDVSLKMNNLDYLAYTYQALDSAYATAGIKDKAYDYRVLYDKYNDSLKSETKARQLTLAEVNAESQRLKVRQLREEEALRKKHNLQYMGITAAIASVFVLLVLLGFFTTTASIIRGFGFFAFIFFFEFLTLLFDHAIHEWTHGEPLKIMAIKIVFVALLVPLHHWVEEKVIHHLIHRKKIRIGKKKAAMAAATAEV